MDLEEHYNLQVVYAQQEDTVSRDLNTQLDVHQELSVLLRDKMKHQIV